MITYFYWWYFEEPLILWRAVRIITKKIFFSFSVSVLLRTLFDPWRRDVTYVENASLQELFNIWLGNFISRLVGFVVRTFTILVGFILTMISLVILLAFILAWFLSPVIIILLIINGVTAIFNG